MALRTVGVRLAAEVSGYVTSMRTARQSTQDFVGSLDKAARAGKLDAVATQVTHLGLGLAGLATGVVAMAAQFDKQMSSVAAATHASTAELDQLRQAAIAAGKDTQYSATEAAKGIEELSKAGVSTSDVLGGGLKGALNLAAAGELDVGEAAETAASAMTQFGLKGSQVPHIADLLAAGAGKAQGSVHDMALALNQSGLVASQMGLSVEDTTGALAAFASAGLLGSDAGTSFKQMLLSLANPTKQATDTMQELGISAYDAQGKFVGVTDLAQQLQDRLGKLTQQQRNQALATIFGSDAIRAAAILYKDGAQGVQDWISKVNDSGYAAETAAKKTDNLAGDLERLKGSLETMAIQSGSGANSGLRILTKSAGALVDQFGQLPPVVGSAITVVAGLSGAALLAGAGWVRLRRGTADALEELRKTGPVGTRAATGLEKATKWAGRAAAAFAALQIAGAVLESQQKDLNIQVDALGKGLSDWGKNGVLAGEAARTLGQNMDDLNVGLKFLADTDNSRRQFVRWGQDLLESVVPGLAGTNTSLTKTRERVDAVDQALAGLVQGGRADDAKAAFDRLAESAAKDGVSVDELKALFPAYQAALETAGSATGDTATQIGDMGAAADKTTQEIDAMAQAFDGLFKVQLDADEALIRYKQGVIDLHKELTQGKRTLDINTKAGRDNASAVLDQIKRIKELRDARYNQGETLDQVNTKYTKDIDGLRATLLQLGYNKKQVDDLVGAYDSIPDQVDTQVGAPGAPKATAQAESFNFAIRNIPPSKTVPFYASTAEANAAVNVLKQKIDSLHDKHITVHGTVYWTSSGNLHVPGGTLLKNRWGGAYVHAAEGALRDAAVYSPAGPARYAFAEPATGGEAFVPKYGDMRRSLSVLQTAAGWYGQTLTTQPASQSAQPSTVNVRVYIGDRELTDMVRVEVAETNRGIKRRTLAGNGRSR